MRRFNSKALGAVFAGAMSVPLLSGAALAEGKRWWLDVDAGVEYDDHVSVEQNDVNTAMGDSAAVLGLDAGYKLVDEKDARVEVGYNFYQSLYQDLSAFNYQSHNPSFMAWIKPGAVKLGFEYSYTHSMLDGAFFLDQHMLAPTASTFLTEELYLSTYYRFYDKNFNSADDGRDATTHQAGADLYYYFDKPNKGYFSLGGGFTSENTTSNQYDYEGFMGRAAVQAPIQLFSKKGKIKFSYTFQQRDYDDPLSLPLPPAGDVRADDRHTLRLNTELEINDDLKAILDLRHVNRSSNLATADYQENVGNVSLRYSF